MSIGEKLYVLSTKYEMPKPIAPKIGYSKKLKVPETIIGEGKDNYYVRYTDPYTGKQEVSWVAKSDIDFNPADKDKMDKDYQNRLAQIAKGNAQYVQSEQARFNQQSGFDKFSEIFGNRYRNALVGAPLPQYEQSTGSKVGDVLTELAATGAAFGLNPGAGSGSIWSGFSRVGEKVAEKVVPKTMQAAAKTAAKSAPKTFSNVLTAAGMKAPMAAAKEAGTFATMGAYESAVGKKDAGDTAKTIAGDALLGAGFGVAGSYLGESFKLLKTYLKKAPKELKTATEPVTLEKVNTAPALKATSPEGKYKIKNTGWEKAVSDYNAAIEKIQNHFKTNELRANEIPLIKSELKIDLDEIIGRMEKYETKSTRQLLQEAESISKVKRAAGLAEDKTYDIIDAARQNRITAASEGQKGEIGSSVQKAAMYKSRFKDVGDFYDFVVENKGNKAEQNKSYYQAATSSGSTVDVPSEAINHLINRHGLTKEQSSKFIESLDNVLEASEYTGSKPYDGKRIKVKIDTPLGKAGVVIDYFKSGRVLLKTVFVDNEKAISSWMKQGDFSLLSQASKERSAAFSTDNHLSISSIQQALGIVKKPSKSKVATIESGTFDKTISVKPTPLEVSSVKSSGKKRPRETTKSDFNDLLAQDNVYIRTVRTPQKDIEGRVSTPSGKLGIEMGIKSYHTGVSGFKGSDSKRLFEWMTHEGWPNENVAAYRGKPTKEQTVLDRGEVEFNPSKIIVSVPTKTFIEAEGDFHKAVVIDAVNKGKSVPDDVLKDYPDIMQKGSKTVEGVMAKAVKTESLIKKKMELPFEEGKGVEMVKRSDIEKFISESLDIPVAQGKYRQKAYGIFKVKPEVIRLKQTKDIETLFHETGHFLDKKLNLRSKASYNELIPLGKVTSRPDYTKDTIMAEGVAEFVRYYLVDPKQAKKLAPFFYDYFTSILKKDTRLDGMMKTIQKATENYIKQDPQARLLSNVSVGKFNLKERARKAMREANAEKLYSITIDELKPLQRVVDEITGGKKISSSENPFELAWLNRGWQGRAEAFLKFGRVDKNFNKVGKSFEEILKPVNKNLDDFRAYAIAKRAKELANREIETGILRQDIDAVLSRHSGKDFDTVLDDLMKYQDDVLNELVTSGVLGKESIESMRKLNRDYIPFQRVMEQFQKGGGIGKGYQAYSPVKGIKGSTRDIIDPLESIIKNTYVAINMAERNRVGKALVLLDQKFDGLGKFFDKVPPKMMGQTIKLKDIEKALQDAGADTEAINLEQVANIFRPNRFVGKDNIITVFREGNPEYYEVFDESLYRSMLSLDRESMNTLTKLLSFPAKILRAGATLTPEFVARNPLRDMLSAVVYSKYGFFPVVDTARGLFHAIRKDDLYLKWISSGGANSMFVSMDRDYLQKNLRSMLKTSMKDKALNIITHPMEALRTFSEFTEIATRLGEFGKGIEKEGMTAEGIRKAALASRDITLDFARSGTAGKQINKVVAFFNASLQGTDKLIRTFKERPLQATTKAVACITLPSVLLYYANKDDKRYQELPQWQKDTFWIILTKDKIYRIPKPFELGMIFGTVPERMLQWIEGNDKEAFDGFGQRLKETFVPDVIPTALLPIVEAWTNYSFFQGRNIVTQSESKLEPWAQYSAYTSETAKLLGKALNQSPKIIENTITGYGAGTADYALDVSDLLLKASGMIKAKTLPKATIEQYPLFKGLMSKAFQSSDSVDKFYDRLDELEKSYATAKKDKKPFSDMAELKLLRKQKDKLSEIRKQINKVYESSDYTGEKKAEVINSRTIDMINIARRALGKDPVEKD
jgi:transcription termination factor NusB